MRCWANVSAQGWTSPGFRSAAMLRSYLGEILCHRPERSGLPSTVRGAGAVRFGLPFAARGIPGVGYFSHCASRGVLVTDNKMSARKTGERLMVVTSLYDVIAVWPGRWRSASLDTPAT